MCQWDPLLAGHPLPSANNMNAMDMQYDEVSASCDDGDDANKVVPDILMLPPICLINLT